MYCRYPISTNILLCLLLILLVGCDQSGDVTASGTLTSASNTAELSVRKPAEQESHYEQLLRKRLDFEAKIREAMDLYRTTYQKVRGQRTELKKCAGDMPVPKVIELFGKGKASEIPSNLRAAYSCWRTLIPDETQLKQIDVWIDTQQRSGVLEELDIQIKNIENRQQLGRILDQTELAEIDRLLARPVVGWETVDASNMAVLEQQVIEELMSANWE
jgi:hypothetical protein